MARVERSHCDLSQPRRQRPSVQTAPSSSQLGGTLGGTNFLWVASDAAETETAAAPVFAERQELEPVALQPGVWVRPEAGMVPPVFPICTSSPYSEDGHIPPNEWDRG